MKKSFVLMVAGVMSAMMAFAVEQDPMLIADYNRDGKIDAADYERYAAGETFTIWLNDDDDAEGAEADDGKGDTNNDLHDVPGGEGNDRDCEDDHVNGRCDLLDFFPVLIDVTCVDEWQNYDWKLSSKSVNIVFTRLKDYNAGSFHTQELKDFYEDIPLYKAVVKQLAGDDGEEAELPDGFLVGGRGVIIVEGAALGDKGLTLRGYRGDGVIAEVTMNLSVTNVEDLYGWMNLRGESVLLRELPPSQVTEDARRIQGDNRHFVLVHGYNTNHEEARGNAAEFYKKLWQSGSDAKFTAVEWRGDQSQVKFEPFGLNFTPNYLVNVENAFAAAKPFADACKKLPGAKILVGHSLGNLLIASAIKDYGLDYTKFVMLNAAVAREAFDASAYDEDMVDEDWLEDGVGVEGGGGVEEEKSPSDHLDRAARWHQNFADHKYDPSEYRRKLAWRGRFAKLSRTINYYSPTDNVLLNPDPNEKDPDKYEVEKVFLEYHKRLIGTTGQKTGFGFWSFSEKMKGTWVVDVVNEAMVQILEVAESDKMKCEGGWGENADYEEDKPFDPANTRFTPFLDERMKRQDMLEIPPAEAERLRAQHLADAIPAESFAAGANPVATLDNVNLESFIGDNPNWPVYEGDDVHTNEWKHSTFREVAFYHTSKLYSSLAAVCNQPADTVVYGTIYTADKKNPIAEAIAIKDGKYIYVGNEDGAKEFISDGVTEVVDHRGKGMVMPGCTDGHSHYTMKFCMDNMKGGVMFDIKDDKSAVLKKVEAAAIKAKEAGKRSLFGFGWSIINLLVNERPTLAELDEVTHGVSTVIFDQGGHHAYCNSECLKRCGIIDGEGNVLIKEIDGGLLELDKNGYPTGYAEERVTGYLMRMGGINYDEIIDDDVAKAAISATQKLLLSTGYTVALEGWSNMFHPSKLYEAAKSMDDNGELTLVFPMTYEVEPWQTDIDKEIAYLESLKATYGTQHVRPEYLKVFMDGVVETKTGAMVKPYKDGTVYKSFWSIERLADITRASNAKGLTVHTHTMGDAAIMETAEAYIQGGDELRRNCLVHLRNVRKEDFQRFADNNIACSAGLTWHVSNGKDYDKLMSEFLDDEYVNHAYPIKSFFDAGIRVSSHSDFPANIPCPQDPFGIMEVAITGQMQNPSTGEFLLPPYDTEELVTREQVFEALTINGAWQIGLEDERGSIVVGKWADFVLVNRDAFACAVNEIHDTKVVSTWFEGKKVYQAAEGSEANAWKVGAVGHEGEVVAYTNGVGRLFIKGKGAIATTPWIGSGAADIEELLVAEGVEANFDALMKPLTNLHGVNGLSLAEFNSAAVGAVKAAGFSAIAVNPETKKAMLTLVVKKANDIDAKEEDWTEAATTDVEVDASSPTGFYKVAPAVK